MSKLRHKMESSPSQEEINQDLDTDHLTLSELLNHETVQSSEQKIGSTVRVTSYAMFEHTCVYWEGGMNCG